MIVLNGNSADVTIQLTKGSTFTLPFVRPSGSTFPAFTSRTWTLTIFDTSNETEVATGTVTVTDADNMSAVVTAATTATLEWSGVDYGFNLKGTSGAVVDIPIKGALLVRRSDR